MHVLKEFCHFSKIILERKRKNEIEINRYFIKSINKFCRNKTMIQEIVFSFKKKRKKITFRGNHDQHILTCPKGGSRDLTEHLSCKIKYKNINIIYSTHGNYIKNFLIAYLLITDIFYEQI